MRNCCLLLLFFFCSSGALFSQEYCRKILVQARVAFEEQDFQKALAKLKDVETCDHELQLTNDRIGLQNEIFRAISRQRELAEMAKQQAEKLRDVAEKQRIFALEQERIALEQRAFAEKRRVIAVSQELLADSARIEAEKATKKALVWEMAYRAEIAPNRSTEFRMLELALQIDSSNSEIQQKLLNNYYRKNDYYSFRLVGHESAVRFLAFFPDGNKCFSASEGTMKVWNINEQRELFSQSVDRNLNRETTLAFSPKRNIVARVLGDRIVVWNISKDRFEDQYLFPADRSRILSLAFSPDGNQLASGTEDGTIKIWDIHRDKGEQKEITFFPLTGHSTNVLSIAFSSDGTKLVSTSLEDMIVWDLKKRVKLFAKTPHNQPISDASFSSDGNLIASASADESIKIWDVNSQQELHTLLGHTEEVSKVDFSPDGLKLVSASYDGTAKVWEIKTGVELFTLKGHRGPLGNAVFSPNGDKIGTCAADGEVMIWNLIDKPDEFDIRRYTNRRRPVSFSDNFTKALTYTDRRIQVWDLENRKRLYDFQAEKESKGLIDRSYKVQSAKISPDGSKALSISDADIIRVWDLSRQQELFVLRGHKGAVNAASFSSDGSKVISASNDGTVKLWDISTQREIATFSGPEGHAKLAMLNFDDSKVIAMYKTKLSEDEFEKLYWEKMRSIDQDDDDAVEKLEQELDNLENQGEVIVWNVSKRKVLFQRKFTDTKVLNIAIAPDGEKIAVGFTSKDNTFADISVWGTRRKKKKGIYQEEEVLYIGEGGTMNTIAFSPDGEDIITSSNTNVQNFSIIYLDDKESERPFLSQRDGSPTSVSFVDGGRNVIAVMADGSIKKWTKSGRSSTSVYFPAHRLEVIAAAISPDGNLIASSSKDKSVKIWSLNTASEDTTLDKFSPAVSKLSFSSNGQKLATLSRNKIEVSDLNKKQSEIKKIGKNFVVFSPNNNQLLSSTDDFSLKLWDISTTSGDSLILPGHQAEIKSATFSADGSKIASASADSTVKLWNVVDGRIDTTISGFPNIVDMVSLSSTGNKLAAISAKNLYLYDLEQDKKLFQIPGEGFVHFSSDDNWVISCSKGRRADTAFVQNVATGEIEWALIKANIIDAFFHPEVGKNQIILVTDDKVNIYYLDIQSLLTNADKDYQINELLPQQIKSNKLERVFKYADILDEEGNPTPLIQDGNEIKMKRYGNYFYNQRLQTNDIAQKRKYLSQAAALMEACSKIAFVYPKSYYEKRLNSITNILKEMDELEMQKSKKNLPETSNNP